MKHTLRFWCAALLAAAVSVTALQSCIKQDNPPAPVTPVADTVLTEQKMIGKWEAVYYKHASYDTTGKLTYSSGVRKNFGYFENGVGPLGRGWLEMDVSFITFKDDRTYFQSDLYNADTVNYMMWGVFPVRGAWSLLGVDSIRMTTGEVNPVDYTWAYTFKDGTLTLKSYSVSPFDPNNISTLTFIFEKQAK